MFEQKHFSIKEYLNGIYQGDILDNNVRDGLGVYLWDSGEFYYGFLLFNSNRKINIILSLRFQR